MDVLRVFVFGEWSLKEDAQVDAKVTFLKLFNPEKGHRGEGAQWINTARVGEVHPLSLDSDILSEVPSHLISLLSYPL